MRAGARAALFIDLRPPSSSPSSCADAVRAVCRAAYALGVKYIASPVCRLH